MWARIGKVGVYAEPCMGTGVMLMNSPYGPAPREVACELNAFIPNFYRSVKYNYAETARWADWPTLHHDLTAWHRWLLAWGAENAWRVSEDPEYHDPKVAGRWCWGQSSWIGPGWCAGAAAGDTMPFPVTGGGSGVQVQRYGDAGRGGPAIPGLQEGEPLTGERLRPWFRAISTRLARVIILNRSWESALTPSVLQQTPSAPKPEVGIFLDPPYRTTRADGGKRSTGLYQGDTASNDVAAATYHWAVEHGERYRIAYCMHAGDFDVPDGWTVETMGFSGHRDAKKKEDAMDCIMFSPRCVPPVVDPQQEFGW